MENGLCQSLSDLGRALKCRLRCMGRVGHGNMPPSLAGRARRSRSFSFGGGLPVSAGMSLVLMVLSSGERLGPTSGIVRVR